MRKFKWKNYIIKEFNTIIIGTGAAGLNCALHLSNEGLKSDDIALITEDLGGGTSFNTGSDKQTYYKLSVIGDQKDSPYEMAKDLSKGGAMHGDIALIEATNSIREFFHLVDLGIPFPHDKYGGYVGYKTDKDPKQRATSVGPLTSQEMGVKLLKSVRKKDIKIFDHHYVFKILIDKSSSKIRSMGVLAIEKDKLISQKSSQNIFDSVRIFKSSNVVIAIGGPAALYKNSVYPKSQFGGLRLAIDAGCKLQNITESQFGLASKEFRWNLSGSYQQVIPRYLSIDKEKEETEFLQQYFPSFKSLSRAIFLKGYQWPFDADKIENLGSSLIDLAVYYETEILGNNVYLDFTQNSSNYRREELHPIALDYLTRSKAIRKTPIERLEKLNPKAIELYKNNNINITENYLEIAVCNQHLNGGITGDIWWESNIKHLFAIGEVNGSHGIHRPGGSALNSGQVGGLRTAQKITHVYSGISLDLENFYKILEEEISLLHKEILELYESNSFKSKIPPAEFLHKIQARMENYGAIVRPLKNIDVKIKQISRELDQLEKLILIRKNPEFIQFLRLKDILMTQNSFFHAIYNYHQMKGKSRGSSLIIRENIDKQINERKIILPGNLSRFSFILNDLDLSDKIQTLNWNENKFKIEWENVRNIPKEFGWFENLWKKFNNRKIYD